MKSSLLSKVASVGSVKSHVMSESVFFRDKPFVKTSLPILNVAFSGDLDGGLVSGLTIFAGESKTFKTLLGLFCLKSYLEQYPDSIGIIYDSEFGITPDYLTNIGVDITRVIHVPLEHIEQLKFDISKRLDAVSRGDKVFILVDSLGALPSKKEIDDAADEKSVADMTRAKAVRSVLRIISPILTIKDIPCIIINHTYKQLGCLAGDTIVKTTTGEKQIKNVMVGDFVFGTTGIQKVLYVYLPNEIPTDNKEYLELLFDDGSSIQCTDNHKFLLDTYKWVEAKDLKIGSKFI